LDAVANAQKARTKDSVRWKKPGTLRMRRISLAFLTLLVAALSAAKPIPSNASST